MSLKFSLISLDKHLIKNSLWAKFFSQTCGSYLGWLPRMVSKRKVSNWRFHIGSGSSECIWEFVSVGQRQKDLKEQKPLGQDCRWDGGTLVLVHKTHIRRGAYQFRLILAGIGKYAYPGQWQWSQHTCVSILKEVFVGQAKDLILPSIPVDSGVLLLVLLINHCKFLIQKN